MKLPPYTAETPPPRESGLARATAIGALTRTGDIEVWRGVSQIGRSMQYAAKLGGQAYIQRQALDDRIATTEANTKVQDAAKLGTDTIAAYDVKAGQPLSPDVKDYWDGDKLNAFDSKAKDEFFTETFNDFKGRIMSLSKVIKHEGTRKKWVARMLADGATVFKKALNAKLQEHQEETILGYARTAAGNGDLELANKWIGIAEKHGLVGLKKANILREKVKEIANQSILDDIHEAAKELSYTDAIQFLNDIKGIDKADRNDLIARRKRQNEIETATTNRKVRWDALRKVSKDPDSVTDEYLEGLVKPNSLTWDDAEEIRKIRDTENHPLKTSRYKLYSGILDALYRDILKPKEGEEIDLERALEYDQNSDELRNFFETNPDVTPDKAKKFFDELATEAKGDFWGRLQELFIIGTGGRGILPEKKETNTVVMVSPDGRSYNVPIEKRQLFIDNGYKER